MNEDVARRVRAAAVAGWWTILIGAIWLTVGWLAFLAILHSRPWWMLWLWGGHDLTWSTVQTLVLWFFAVFKLLLFVCILAAIWLTLWQRRLRRAA